MTLTYVLDAHHNPVPEPDFGKWATWREKHGSLLSERVGPVRISTVFLGCDPAELGLFESMVFGGLGTIVRQCRYHTYDAAAAGHEALTREFGKVES